MSADILISIITFLVFVAIGAIWDLGLSAHRAKTVWQKVFFDAWEKEFLQNLALKELLRSNPTTRHHLQKRNSKGRFE